MSLDAPNCIIHNNQQAEAIKWPATDVRINIWSVLNIDNSPPHRRAYCSNTPYPTPEP